jgi:hypothetical protein
MVVLLVTTYGCVRKALIEWGMRGKGKGGSANIIKEGGNMVAFFGGGEETDPHLCLNLSV